LHHHEADAAGCLATHGNGERGFRPLREHGAQKLAAVPLGVRMGETVAKVEPDLAVVSVLDERLEIVTPPGSDLAVFERQHVTTLFQRTARAINVTPL
jgi:hypothetical protein